MNGNWHFFPRDETLGHREPSMVKTPNGTNTSRLENELRLIAVAGTAARECAEMGYDPIEAVRALPELLRDMQQALLEANHDGWPDDDHWRNTAQYSLARAAGKEEHDGC